MASIDTEKEESIGWKAGLFQILFFSMGQGDCCIITCPDGRHVMIDCGSKAEEEGTANPMIDVQQLLRSKDVLFHPDNKANRNTIEALILTHADKDHISKVNEILAGKTYNLVQSDKSVKKYKFDPVRVNKVYFGEYDRSRPSGTFDDSPLEHYTLGDCNYAVYNQLGVSELYSVTLATPSDKLTAGYKVIDKWTPPFRAAQHTYPDLFIDKQTMLPVVEAEDKSWRVSIIAGNNTRRTDDSSDTDGKNASSLVTLITIGTKKILICGDATVSTETYLYNTFKDADTIKQVSLMHSPHHGSALTSSTNPFMILAAPEQVIVSVQEYEHTHHLPGWGPVSTYKLYAVETDQSHPVVYWQAVADDEFQQLVKKWQQQKGKNGFDYTVHRDTQGREASYIYKPAPDDYEGEVMLDGLNTPSTGLKYVLRQEVSKKAIRQTGLDSHSWYYFP